VIGDQETVGAKETDLELKEAETGQERGWPRLMDVIRTWWRENQLIRIVDPSTLAFDEMRQRLVTPQMAGIIARVFLGLWQPYNHAILPAAIDDLQAVVQTEIEERAAVKQEGINQLVSISVARDKYKIIFDDTESLAYHLEKRQADSRLLTDEEAKVVTLPLEHQDFNKSQHRDEYEYMHKLFRSINRASGFLRTDDLKVIKLQRDLDLARDSINRQRAKNLNTQGHPEPLDPIPPVRVLVSLNQSSPNAFSAPDGTIVINQSLINVMESEDELAAVLAHELTHFARRFGGNVNIALNSGDILTSKAFAGRFAEYDADAVQRILADLKYNTLAMRSALGNLHVFLAAGVRILRMATIS
jgi:hypothetical protein